MKNGAGRQRLALFDESSESPFKMIEQILNKSLSYLTLGARPHARLNSLMTKEIGAMMERDDWTCHQCGIRLPGMMEVDHLKGHKVSEGYGIAPICQFCHERDHFIWAASHGRFKVLHAPDMSYQDISHLTWALLAHDDAEGFSYDRKKLLRDLAARHEDAVDALGHGNVEALIEAVYGVSDRRGEVFARERCLEIDRHIKFVPSLMLDLDRAPRVWEKAGFRDVAVDWKLAAIPEKFAGYEALRGAGNGLKSRI